MGTTTSDLHPANAARLRLLTFPREHGAWGILLVPLATGAAIGFHTAAAIFPLILLVLAALALFCLRTPSESFLAASPLRPQNAAERRVVLVSMLAYTTVAALALVLLLWLERDFELLLLGAVGAAIFVVQAALKKIGRETRLSAQLIGSLGLTLTAPAAYYVVRGQLDPTALALWAANWLFAANQIHFVQLRIHAARATTRAQKFLRGRNFLLGQACLLLILALGWRAGIFPGLALLAFAPIVLRGLIWMLFSPPKPLNVHYLGLSELAHAVVFGVLLILGYLLGAM